MTKFTKIFLLLATTLSLQIPVHGIIFYSRTGFYLAGSGSIDWNTSNKSFLDVDTELPTLQSGRVRPEDGFNANLSLGYYIDQWRLEVEGSYRKNKGNADFSYGGVTVTDFGYLSEFSTMFNVYYDIPICDWWWGFYLGGGVGPAFSEIEVTGVVGGSVSDVRFAGQLMAGMFYHIKQFRRCAILTFGYRLFATTSPEKFFFSNGVTTAIVTGEGSPITQSLELGLRFSL